MKETPSKPNDAHVDQFARQLHHMEGQVRALIETNTEALEKPLMDEAFVALQTSLEELRVADTELRSQFDAMVRLQNQLRQEQKRYSDLFQLVPDSYIVTSMEGKILEVNIAAMQLLNVDQRYLVGKLLVVFVEQEQRPFFRVQVEHHKTQEEIRRWETRIKPRNVPPIDVALTTATTFNTEGQPLNIRWLVRDISENKRTEREAKRRNRELTTINAIVSEISKTIELPRVLETLRQLLTEAYNIPAGIVWLFDDEQTRYEIAAAWNIPPEMAVIFQPESHDFLPERRTIHQFTFRELRRDEESLWLCELHSAWVGWSDYLSIQLTVDNEVVGFLDLFSKAISPFHASDTAVLKTVSRQIGIAVRNAQMLARLQVAQQQSRTLAQQLVVLQENERRFIAQELHDEVGQALTGLRLIIERVIDKFKPNVDSLPEAIHMLNKLMAQVRNLSLELRPTMLDDLGLLPTLLWHFDHYTKQTGVIIIFKHSALAMPVPLPVATAAYRIIQEALTNIARHAKVTDATVKVWVDDHHINVQIEDQGVGFDRTQTKRRVSAGVAGMRERAMLLGGSFSVESEVGVGTTVSARLPLRDPAQTG